MKKALLVLFATGWFLCGFAQEIQFETVEHDFGLVNYNDPAVFDFVFTNTGTEPLIVQKPKSSCGCTLPSWPKDPIMPGQKEKVSVTYKTNRVGAINKTVTVTSNAKNSPQIVLRIKGRVLEEGGIKPSQKNGKWGLADGNGNVIIQFEYDEIKFAKNGNFNIRKKEKWGIANKTGVVIIPCEYDEEFDLAETMLVKKSGKQGIISTNNKVIIPFEYDEILTTYGGSMPARKGNKWGLIYDRKVVIPCEYDEEFRFAETMPVKKRGKWGAIDKNNKVIIPFEYDGLKRHTSNKEVLFAKKNDKWGLINRNNQAITKFFAEEMRGIYATLVSYTIPIDTNDPTLKLFAGYEGAITTKGKLLVPPCHPGDDSDKAQILFNLVFASIIHQYENIDCNQLDIEKEWEEYFSDKSSSEKKDLINGMKAIQKAIQE